MRDGCCPSCPCQVAYREFDRSRAIFSSITGTRYTVDQIAPDLYVYHYFRDPPPPPAQEPQA